MGVKGLWQLLLPTGRRVSIETLEGKTLAVDVSIWLLQFMKVNTNRGNEDDEYDTWNHHHGQQTLTTGGGWKGSPAALMAIMGFYRRICKLLYHGIRPIFVFDGDTPEIKLREIYARKERREKMNSFGNDERDGDGVKRLAKRLLVQNLKKQKELKKALLLKQSQRKNVNGKEENDSGLLNSGESNTNNDSNNNNGAFASGFQLPRQARQLNEDSEHHNGTVASTGTAAGKGKGTTTATVASTNNENEKEKAEERESDINKILSETKDYLDQHQNLMQSNNATNQQNDWDNTIIINAGNASNDDSEDDSSIEIPQNENDLDTETLSSLPTKTRIDVIERVKRQQRMKSRQEFMSVAANPNSYSQCQLKNFLKSANLSKKINEIGQIASSKSLSALSSTGGGNDSLSFAKGERIASDMTRRFILTKHNGERENDSNDDDDVDDNDDDDDDYSYSNDIQSKSARVRKGDELNPPNPKRRRLKKVSQSQHRENSNDNIDDSFSEDDSVLAETDTGVSNIETDGLYTHPFKDDGSSDNDDNDMGGGFIPPSDYETGGGFIQSNDGERCFTQADEGVGGGFIESNDDDDGGGFIKSAGKDSEGSFVVSHQHVKKNENKVIFELSSDEEDCNNENTKIDNASKEKNIITIDCASDDEGSLSNTDPSNLSKLDEMDKSSQCEDAVILQSKLKDGSSSANSEEESNDDVDWEDGETESFGDSCGGAMNHKLEEKNKIADIPETEIDNDNESLPENFEDESKNNAVEWGDCKAHSEHQVTDFGDYFPGEGNIAKAPHDHSIDANALALEKARATAAGLTDWAGRAVQRAITAHLNESPEKRIIQQNISDKSECESLDSNSNAFSEEEKEEIVTKEKSSGDSTPANSNNEITNIRKNTKTTEHGNQEDQGASTKKHNFENISLDTLYKEVHMKDDLKRIQKDGLNTDDVIEDIIQLLHLFGIPYMKAPTEAEAQCATLEKLGLVDGVITEDSDAFVFGSKCVYKNIFDDKKYVEVYLSNDAEKLGLGVNEKIALAMLLGADYTEGVKGVGIVNGMEILHAFPVSKGVKEGLSAFRNWLDGNDFSDVIDEKGSCTNMLSKEKQYFHSKHKSARLRWIVPQDFPSKKVLQAYTHPVVDNSTAVFSFGKPDVENIRLFCQQKLGWDTHEVNRSLLPVVEKMETGSRQTRLDGYFMRYEDNHTISHQVKSKRLRDVFKKSATSAE